MNRAATATSLLVAMIFLAVATPLWLAPYTLQMKEYGIVLKFEGDKPVIDGKEICKDLVGNIIVKFGNEFQSIDVCELIEKKVIHVFFSEGVKYWMETLDELGIKPGMSAEEILATLRSRGYGVVAMPTVSITFWLISEDLHYIANHMFTSLDYYVSFGYSYLEAYNKMLEDPLAIVREHATILIKSEELVRNLAPINMTRALEGIRRELGLEETFFNETVSTQEWRGCPPGTKWLGGGVCKWENYWGFPDTPPEWFYNRTIVEGGDKNYVVGRLWNNFKKYFGTAYLFHKDIYRNKEDAMYIFWLVWSNPCFHRWSDFGKPINMSTALKTCMNPDSSYQIDWNHTRAPGSEFTMYKPFVIKVQSSIGEMPPVDILLEYGAFQAGFKKTGFSIMGVMIYGNQGHDVGAGVRATYFNPLWWSNYGARATAIIIPAYMKYSFDSFIFTWNIRSYFSSPIYGWFWLFEPVPIITPYYEEVGMASSDYWGRTYYDQNGNCIYGCQSYPQNIYALIDEAAGTLGISYYLIKDTKVNDIPNEDVILDKSNITSVGYSDSLGSLIFGIAKSIVVDLFLDSVFGPFAYLLGLIEYTDTTFSASVVIQYLRWGRIGQTQDNVWARVWKGSKTYLSDYYDEINKKPLLAAYLIEFYTPTGGGPPPCPPNMPCDIPLGESES